MAHLNCPQCRHHLLKPLRHENVRLDACTHCGGVWFDPNELDIVLHRYDPNYRREGSIAKKLGPKVIGSPKKCPRCQVSLTTHEFEQGSDLKIDLCHSCNGVWLDKGELDHAKIFYEIPEAKERIEKEINWAHWLFQFIANLPVEFNVEPRRFPIVTVSLLILNALLLFPVLNSEQIWFQWGLIPGDIGSLKWFVTLLTHQFLHGGWAHLIGNMYFLYILGDNVEDAMGRTLFLLFYLGCGLFAGLTHVIYEFGIGGPVNIPLVGASGAISGVMAAYVYIFRKAKLTFMLLIFPFKMAPIWYFGIWIGTNIVFLVMGVPEVSWAAHLGGFVAGLVFSYWLYDRILEANPLIRYFNEGDQ